MLIRGFKRLFGEVVSAKRFERIMKEIELKVWVYNLILGLGPGSLRRGILTGGGYHEAGDWSWRLLNKAADEVFRQPVEIDYNRDRDVLYISFGPPSAADNAEILDNDIIVGYKGDKAIGITVPDFSSRSG